MQSWLDVFGGNWAANAPAMSLTVLAIEAERGWWCYGCARGGRIYDLASLLAGGPWGPALRDDAFRAARELVAAALW